MHEDYAGLFMDRIFLVVIDACTKWMALSMVKSDTMGITTKAPCFSRHLSIRHNGSVFASVEFVKFMKINGIRHIWTVPFKPLSKRMAERAV